jgi:uncharacterized iron-regulated membrane protein
VVLGAIFPLVGLSLLVVFCLEYIVLRHRPRLQRILG